MAHGALTAIIGLRLLALAAGLRHNAEIGQPGLCFSAYGHKFGINHLVGLGANRRRAGRVDGARQYRRRENTMGMESRPNSDYTRTWSPPARSSTPSSPTGHACAT